ncbi:membrane protein insertase YidC [Methyloceanibacter caenitepidi]|uniref:Inner membrane protein translocase component YidC, long form n=1 Tax=Methyloceanibacter caenitepidi TaxID=1384459 RepID=A0A0A8JY34_9HYPH|nr:membrane protein insertase YidC [Methyloceanibacter caenitepidi]BAQ15708.1 inner membrane protein translocase component YidC, long form [Methyloceanibacter caenitepidi]
MDVLKTILWPLIAALEIALELIYSLTGSYGLSIICVSLLVSTLLLPVAATARRLEAKDKARLDLMAPQVAEIRASYRGQERFERIDEVYREYGYHPIKSTVSLLPLLVQLPFLLAALLLLSDYPPIEGTPFLFLPDLAAPDHLIKIGGAAVNVLPFALIAVTLIEAWLKRESTPQSRRRFLIVALVLLVLIYPAPSGVCLYWFASASFSLSRTIVAQSFA